jgi:hypothetical protein
MTDRYHTLTVVLEANMRDDDAEHLMAAIRCMKRVLSVHGVVANYESIMAEDRAKRELGEKLWNVIYPERKR